MPKGTIFRVERALDALGIGMNSTPTAPVSTTNYDASSEPPVAPTERGKAKLRAIIAARNATLPKSTGLGLRTGISRGIGP